MGQFSYGSLYVIATLLPLASFIVLFLGGRRWGKAGAYVAIGAIAGACVLSVIGLVGYLSHSPTHDHAATTEHVAQSHAHPDNSPSEGPPWKGHIHWAVIHYADIHEPAVALRLGYYIDGLAVVMFCMITFVATLIHVFSIGYMSEELQETVEDHQAHVTRRGRFSRFFMFLSLFCFSMLNLVLADNLFQVFVSWELVGICSYLLIGFYYERQSASNAANKAFITNRIGDAGFILGVLILWTSLGTLNFYSTEQVVTDENGVVVTDEHGHPLKSFSEIGIFDRMRCYATRDAHHAKLELAGHIVRAEPIEDGEFEGGHDLRVLPPDEPTTTSTQVILFPPELPDHYHGPVPGEILSVYDNPEPGEHSSMPYWLLVVAGAGIFLGCVGKSAQFPLHVWLPDAMEGPTPVSALIHAATMVAAGVYLVGRVYPLFTSEVLLIIAYVGGITLFVAATIAIVQTDIKRVLAYSTVSQLGYMMLALGVGGWVAGLLHLITHAFFKALLFLCSGSVIYACHHEQEMTRMGGLFPKMKITALTMLVGVLAISGTPLFSGWYSKDAIMVSALSFSTLRPEHLLLFILPLLTAGITCFYMFRLWFMTFAGRPRDDHVFAHAHESPPVMTWPLIGLALFSIIVAWGANPFNVQGSALEKLLHHEYPSILPDLTFVDHSRVVDLAESDSVITSLVAYQLDKNTYLGGIGLPRPHQLAGGLALVVAALGTALAFVIYYFRLLDAAQTKEKFAGVFRFLWHKWYFDEFYRVVAVHSAVRVSRACRWIDMAVIDGLVDWSGRMTVRLSRWDGRFDLGIVDGLVNLTARVFYGVGTWLRVVQTGLIRQYVLFLAVAAVGIFAILSYVLAMAG